MLIAIKKKEGELLQLVQKLDGVEIVSHYYDKENWCVIGKRIK
jgi:hypothetical protein